MRLYAAGLIAETNLFSTIPTGLGAFERRTSANPNGGGFAAPLEAVRQAASQFGAVVLEGPCAAAQPLGLVGAEAWATLRREVIDGLNAVMPVDAVVLLLHGAMSAEGCDDCEGDLIDAVRAIVGPEVPIGVELDPHCHFTERMRASADVIVAYKEYPHTDIAEQAALVTTLTLRAARSEIAPVMGVFDCRVIGLFPTVREPMQSFVDEMRALEARDGVLAVSLGHGFAYADVPEAGAKLWVVADGDMSLAEQCAEMLGRRFFELREQVSVRYDTLSAAIAELTASKSVRPLVLADVADNPGGGARGDSTFILAALEAGGLGGVALGGIWDPGAVQTCREAGVGSRLLLRIGGKSGVAAGAPLDVWVVVQAIRDDHAQTEFGVRASLGPAAWVRTDNGVDVVLISRCQQVLGVDMFTGLGVPIDTARGIVVKSMQHFAASFAPLIDRIIYVDTPGLLRSDFAAIPYRRRDLSYWPRVANPFSA